MTDRIILVTGAGSGIGKTTARRLGELESVVIVVDQNGDNARETVQDLKQSNRRAVAIEADVSTPNDVARVFSDVEGKYQRLDGIIHCAGIGAEKTILETTLEDWERLIRVNLTGTFLCAQAAAAVFLVSEASRYISDLVLPIDGGFIEGGVIKRQSNPS